MGLNRRAARSAALMLLMAAGASGAFEPPKPQGGESLSSDFGVTVTAKDNTAALNRWLEHCQRHKLTCRLVLPERGTLMACGIVIPGPDLTLQGPGIGVVALTATAGCNRHFIVVPPVGELGGRPMLRDLRINCANYANTQGHCIHLPADEGKRYGVGIDLVNVYVDRAAEDALHVERNRGAGMLFNTYLYHYRRTGLHLASSDWNCIASNFSGNHQPGQFAEYGVRIVAGANNTFLNCRSYANRIGVATEYPSVSTPLTWIGGDMSDNALHGAFIDSAGLPQSVVISGARFTNNSQSASGEHADIVLSRNSGSILSNNIFQRGQTSQSRVLIETRNPTGPAVVVGNAWNAGNPRFQPFVQAITNDPDNVALSAQASARGELRPAESEVLGAVTNDGRGAVQLTRDRRPAGPTNTLRLAADNGKLIMHDITVTASDPNSGDLAIWTVDRIIATRATGPASVSIAAYTPVVTRVAQTGPLVGLESPLISADTRMGGVAISVKGLEGLPLRWVLTGRIQEIR